MKDIPRSVIKCDGSAASNSQLPPSGKGNQHKGKRPWTENEDKVLLDYVAVHGAGNWRNVQKLTNLNRNAQSCRLRWTSHLDPNVNKSPFTEEEDEKLLRLIKWENDIKWVTIANMHFPTRTGYQLQTRWHVLMNRQHKKLVEQGIMPEDPPTISLPRMSSFAAHISTGFSPTTPSPVGMHSLPIYGSSQLLNSPKLCVSPSSLSKLERKKSTTLSSPLSSYSPRTSSAHLVSPRSSSHPAQSPVSSSPKPTSAFPFPPWIKFSKSTSKVTSADSLVVDGGKNDIKREDKRVDNGGSPRNISNHPLSSKFVDLNAEIPSLCNINNMDSQKVKANKFPPWIKANALALFDLKMGAADPTLKSVFEFANLAKPQENVSLETANKNPVVLLSNQIKSETEVEQPDLRKKVFGFDLNDKCRDANDCLIRKRKALESNESESDLSEKCAEKRIASCDFVAELQTKSSMVGYPVLPNPGHVMNAIPLQIFSYGDSEEKNKTPDALDYKSPGTIRSAFGVQPHEIMEMMNNRNESGIPHFCTDLDPNPLILIDSRKDSPSKRWMNQNEKVVGQVIANGEKTDTKDEIKVNDEAPILKSNSDLNLDLKLNLPGY